MEYLHFMKALQKDQAKVKSNAITVKPFPGKLQKGQTMINKLAHAKAVSASIKGFKE